ncbi:hypothetical protein [Ignatzschineria sp. F8392]|uniref:hypothetical protein n=1 Tax=Ignatzschineria sp. F8392 TaxID=1980117 RepID=UPI001303213A|nr:hypothetical protein [Ignatzschineria sp. F8392]
MPEITIALFQKLRAGNGALSMPDLEKVPTWAFYLIPCSVYRSYQSFYNSSISTGCCYLRVGRV